MHNFCKTILSNTFNGTGNSDINRWSGKVVGVFTFVRQQILFSIDQEIYVLLRSDFQTDSLSEILTTAGRRI